jgi:hypothetical protein
LSGLTRWHGVRDSHFLGGSRAPPCRWEVAKEEKVWERVFSAYKAILEDGPFKEGGGIRRLTTSLATEVSCLREILADISNSE